jgi:hypothetical protein
LQGDGLPYLEHQWTRARRERIENFIRHRMPESHQVRTRRVGEVGRYLIEDHHSLLRRFGPACPPFAKAGPAEDTVGDPCKDTAGLGLDSLMKATDIVALLLMPLLQGTGPGGVCPCCACLIEGRPRRPPGPFLS